MAAGTGGRVHVADTLNDRIQTFDADGNPLASWGERGEGDGQFRGPHGVAVDSAGRIYVADTFNHRIQAFEGDGSYRQSWGEGGSEPGEFASPFGVAAGPEGRVYVADTLNHRVQAFDSAGAWLTDWGTDGNGPAQFQGPRAVAVDAGGAIYVADEQGSHRVQKFAASIDGLVAGLLDHALAAVSLPPPPSTSAGHPPGRPADALPALEAFIERVEGQRGLRLADAQADFLVAAARVMIASLGG